MHIYMLATRYGSEDGFRAFVFHTRHHYDIADALATRFIAGGWAVESKYVPHTGTHTGAKHDHVP